MIVEEIKLYKLTAKVGYVWRNLDEPSVTSDCLYVNSIDNIGSWEEVKDDNAKGTESNPFLDKSVLVDNAFYLIDGVRYVYMSGQWVEF